jgi:hypothetical protein
VAHPFHSVDVEALAAHITRFSLAGIREIAKIPKTRRKKSRS